MIKELEMEGHGDNELQPLFPEVWQIGAEWEFILGTKNGQRKS